MGGWVFGGTLVFNIMILCNPEINSYIRESVLF